MVPGRSRWRVVLLWLLLAAGPAAHVSLSAQEQPPKRPAQDEFVPVSELPPQEQLPAAPLLIAAYAVAWVVVVGYSVLDLAAPGPGRAASSRRSAAACSSADR